MNQVPSGRDGSEALPEIAGYRLLRAIGSGGMSTVYLGEQVSLGRQVAIKVMLPAALADEVSRRRFENEARTIARLEHPHIVGIHEVGRTRDGLPYYAMPYLPRGHLGQRIAAAHGVGMDQQRIRDILSALLSALGYAHARGTIHRDVKAENVLFDEAERPLLADFGIALRRGYGTRVTTAGLAVGSTAYMAPEQARGEEVDQRADLYAVGVLAWEMLTGDLPYDAKDAVSMAVMHVKDPIPRLPPRLRHWQRFFDRALAKGPLKRYRDAPHMQEMLERVPRRHDTREFFAVPALRTGTGLLRAMPLTAWLGVLLVVAATLGMLLRGPESEHEAFYRVVAQPAMAQDPDRTLALPAPVAEADRAVVDDPAGALLRAAPASEAERWVAAADQQIRQGRLLAPKGGNAFESLQAAHARDPAYLGIAPAAARLIDALANDALRAIADQDDARARTAIAQTAQVAQRLQTTDSAALARLRAGVVKALSARIARAAAAYDREAAVRVADAAAELGVDAAGVRKLAARAQRIPAPGERLEHAEDMLLVGHGDTAFAVARRAVTRDEYAAFAAATGRGESLCRERASLLRILAPRTWKSPGFAQVGAQPVVCVSWADAEAYAHWRGQRDGRRYRLPSVQEAKSMPVAQDTVRAVAEWSRDCGDGCGQRIGAGASWRGAKGTRALEADRGYDDVGIRLIGDLPDIVAGR